MSEPTEQEVRAARFIVRYGRRSLLKGPSVLSLEEAQALLRRFAEVYPTAAELDRQVGRGLERS